MPRSNCSSGPSFHTPAALHISAAAAAPGSSASNTSNRQPCAACIAAHAATGARGVAQVVQEVKWLRYTVYASLLSYSNARIIIMRACAPLRYNARTWSCAIVLIISECLLWIVILKLNQMPAS